MKIYLAGENNKKRIISIVHGENSEEKMKLYLAGGETRHWLHDYTIVCEEGMKIYLAGTAPWRADGLYDSTTKQYKPYILESFYYVDDDTKRLLPYFGDFLLDSGAFTFMQGKGSATNWEEYIERYGLFIKENNIRKYFELDIDSVVGYEKVKEYRKRLENLVGWPCIPVWHKSRGAKDFSKICDEYGYVAIGGIVSGEIKKEQYSIFPTMIAEAHKRECKIHGLGFTSLKWLPVCHFDSVDSTAWTTGNRFGHVYKFNGKTMVTIDCPKGKRVDGRKVALNNYIEWIKFQRYADVYL